MCGPASREIERALSLSGAEKRITVLPHADYRYRTTITRDELSRLLIALGTSIDYPNFKKEIATHPDQRDRLAAYHEIWHVLQDLQQ